MPHWHHDIPSMQRAPPACAAATRCPFHRTAIVTTAAAAAAAAWAALDWDDAGKPADGGVTGTLQLQTILEVLGQPAVQLAGRACREQVQIRSAAYPENHYRGVLVFFWGGDYFSRISKFNPES